MELFDRFKRNMRDEMTWDELNEYFKGKVFLIGLSFIDKNGNLIEQYQTHGTIIELTDKSLFKIKRDDCSIIQMPYDRDTISKAEKGEYREHSTGIVIKNPDFIMTWEIDLTGSEESSQIKRFGFIPPEYNENSYC